MNYIEIGASPCNEPCAQVGEPDYPETSRAECARFITLIRAVLGPEPDGARLATKAFRHDYGTYREVVCYYDETPGAADYAFRCERTAPQDWDPSPGLDLTANA